MKIFRYVTVMDVVVFIGMGLLVTGLVVGAILTPQKWDVYKISILSVALFSLWSVGIGAIVSFYRQRPTFILEGRGIAVWTNGIIDVTPDRVRKAIECMLIFLSDQREYFAADEMLRTPRVFDGMTIEFKTGTISAMGMGWVISGKAGIQKGKHVIVQWKGSLTLSEFFHEMLHVVDEFVRWKVDYKHEDKMFWDMEEKIKSFYLSRACTIK